MARRGGDHAGLGLPGTKQHERLQARGDTRDADAGNALAEDGNELVAARRDLRLQGAGYSSAGGSVRHAPALVIGYACPPPHAFAPALARLAAALVYDR